MAGFGGGYDPPQPKVPSKDDDSGYDRSPDTGPEDLRPKPPIEDMPPEEGVEDDGEEVEVAEGEYMTPEEADEDDTVDDKESPEEQEQK